jgi:PAS domain-containing protein
MISHFMWGYQSHFRIGQKTHAKALFSLLDRRFQPEVFLVGILVEGRTGRYPACVEPEKDFWLQSESFDDVLSRLKRIVPTYPESHIRQSHPLAQKWHDEGLIKRAVQDAISEVITEHPDRPEGVRYLPSWPVPVDDFLVSLVLGLQDDVIRSHAALNSDRVKMNEYRSLRVSPSLIRAVTDEYLSDVAGELLKPDPGADPMAGKSPDEILRAAGKRLMAGVAQRADTWDNQEGREEVLFDCCNRLSALKYEGAGSVGRAVLARKDHPAAKRSATFVRSVPVTNARALRKLLELSKGDLALHMNARDVFGLTNVVDYEEGQEDLFEINILDRHLWELAHAGQALMRVQDGLPSLPAPLFDAARVRVDLQRVFRGITEAQAGVLMGLVHEAATEKHGTMLVISEDAAGEARRLASQATPLEPCLLTPELVRQLTPIDGAVLLDPTGTCHAIGVILDGMATDKGNPARGARFNSAIRYVETRDSACMAIVISEDGGVDLVPDLRPPIRRSEIEQRLTMLEDMLRVRHVRRSQYLDLMEWFREHCFYLLREHCDRLSRSVGAIEALIQEEAPEAPTMIWGEFEPDKGMDEALYYEKE